MTITLATRAFRFVDRWERLARPDKPLTQDALAGLERRDEALEVYLAEVRRGSVGVSAQASSDVTLSNVVQTLATVPFSTLYRDSTVCVFAVIDFNVSVLTGTAVNVGTVQIDGVDATPVWPLPFATSLWPSGSPQLIQDPKGTAMRQTVAQQYPNVNVQEPGPHTVTLLARKTALQNTVVAARQHSTIRVTWTP